MKKLIENTPFIILIDTALEAYIRWEDFSPEKAERLACRVGFIGGVIFGSLVFWVVS